MFDSQKLSFEKFIFSYKHGVYVITNDSCSYCQEYKDSIKYINNANLYFVEVTNDQEKNVIYQLTQYKIFPLTIYYKDNKIKFIRAGQLFEGKGGLDKFYEALKELGDKPLTDDEIERRIKKEKSKCILSYYIFPPNCTDEIKNKLIAKSIDFNELPIDIDNLAPMLDLNQRAHLLENNYPFAKLIIYKDNDTNRYSNLAHRILIEYAAVNGETDRLIIRNINDVLNEEINVTNNTNK